MGRRDALGPRYWGTIWLSIAAIGVWILSLWVEAHWPWLPFDQGGPWPQSFSLSWKKALLLWCVYWGGLSGYWTLRMYLQSWRPRIMIVLGVVSVLHVLLYFILTVVFHKHLFGEIGKALTLLANRRLFGIYLSVVRMRLPSFVVGGISWLLFTEFSNWVVLKKEGCQNSK